MLSELNVFENETLFTTLLNITQNINKHSLKVEKIKSEFEKNQLQSNQENSKFSSFFISLTQNNDGTWNIVVTSMDGDAIYSENNLGAYKGANPGVYTNYALNAILYGIPAGFYPYGDPLTVYATEVRGTSAS